MKIECGYKYAIDNQNTSKKSKTITNPTTKIEILVNLDGILKIVV